MVEGKILDWFDYRGTFLRFLHVLMSNFILFAESRVYQWLRRNTIDRLIFKHPDPLDVDAEAAWREGQDVETALKNYLDDMPSMSFIY